MKFKEINERRKVPKYSVINYDHARNDVVSVINKLKKEFPEQKIGIRNGFIHFNLKEVYDLKDKPLDINRVKALINKIVNDGN